MVDELYDPDFDAELMDGESLTDAPVATATKRKAKGQKSEGEDAPADDDAAPDAEAGDSVPDQGNGADDGGAPPTATRGDPPAARVRGLSISPFPNFLSVEGQFRMDCPNVRDAIHGEAFRLIHARLAPIQAEHFASDTDYLQSLEWRKALAAMVEDGKAKEKELTQLSAKLEGASAADYVSMADQRDIAEALVSVKTARLTELQAKIAALEKASSTRLEKKLRESLNELRNESLKEKKPTEAELLTAMCPLIIRLAVGERVRSSYSMPLTQYLRPPVA